MKEDLMRPLTAGLVALGLATAVGIGQADEQGGRKSGVAPVNNDTYAQECGACHFAYPPGLMSSASWKKLFSNLHDHFGENAELPADTAKTLLDYVTANAADKSDYELSQKIMRSYGKATPVRITEVPYIAREHRTVIGPYVKNNPEVGSLSRCQTCHTDGDEGRFSERAINVPGHGPWKEDEGRN
jgi:hypothetical protein